MARVNQIVEWTIEPAQRAQGVRIPAQLVGVLLGLACTGASCGAAIGAWSGEMAMAGLVVVALLGGFCLLLQQHPRVSSIYAVALGFGLIGLMMCAFGVSPAIVIPGGLLCGLMAWALGRIVRKGWFYAR
ncbi:hypothetical protein [Burkholderia multivorans]|uniref:hypothetical protein n=1 Tax=Burkholderia multivorans TaxID=87883 RepID=UPI0015E35E89|nr:hypothetical protein [Burkholderia multivorans]